MAGPRFLIPQGPATTPNQEATVTAQRHTTRRNRHRKIIARGRPPCHLCGGEIDYDAEDHLAPNAFVIDHLVPLSRGGADTLDNLAPAHRGCNLSRYNKPLPGQQLPEPEPKPGVTFVTHRDWWSNPGAKVPLRGPLRPARA